MTARTLDMSRDGDRFEDAGTFRGVRTRRMFAFVFDYIVIGFLLIPVALFVFILGFLTIGIGWLLFWVLGPLTALLYVAITLGGRHQSTLGMRLMGIRLERLDGRTVDPLTAILHTVLFWAGNAILTPLILLLALVLPYKRTLHDLLLGTVVTRLP